MSFECVLRSLSRAKLVIENYICWFFLLFSFVRWKLERFVSWSPLFIYEFLIFLSNFITMVYYIYIDQTTIHLILCIFLSIFHLILCVLYPHGIISVYFDFVYSLICLYANRVRYVDDYLLILSTICQTPVTYLKLQTFKLLSWSL